MSQEIIQVKKFYHSTTLNIEGPQLEEIIVAESIDCELSYKIKVLLEIIEDSVLVSIESNTTIEISELDFFYG